MKNVLLLCLSKLREGSFQPRTYQYYVSTTDRETVQKITGIISGRSSMDLNSQIIPQGDQLLFVGDQTNDTPVKQLICELGCQGNTLDEIVIICTEKVMNLRSSTANLYVKPRGLGDTVTANEYYQAIVSQFATDLFPELYSEHSIKFQTVLVSDEPSEHESTDAVIHAAQYITSHHEEVNIFIDYNGGMRFVAYLLLAISNLIQSSKGDLAQIQKVYNINYVPNERGTKENPQIINVQHSLFGTFDLVNAISECVNYGRISSLVDYFADAGDERINKLLSEIQTFIEELQLCNTIYIMDHRKTLLTSFEECISASPENTDNPYVTYFRFVIADISNKYEELLTGTLPKIIRWCVKNHYVQQALTFCTEHTPDYLWKSGIFVPTKDELNEYRRFLILAQNNTTYRKRYGLTRRNPGEQDGRASFAYHWLVQYLPFKMKTSTDKDLKLSKSAFPLMNIYPEIKDKNIIMSRIGRKNPFSGWPGAQNLIQDVYWNISDIVWQYQRGAAVCKTKDINQVTKILEMYFLLKEQRNNSNHADGGGASYKQVASALKEIADAMELISDT